MLNWRPDEAGVMGDRGNRRALLPSGSSSNGADRELLGGLARENHYAITTL